MLEDLIFSCCVPAYIGRNTGPESSHPCAKHHWAGLHLTFASSLGDSLGFMPYFLIRAASCSSSLFSGGGLGAAIGVYACLTWSLQQSSTAIAQHYLHTSSRISAVAVPKLNWMVF